MKLILLVAFGILVGLCLTKAAEGAPPPKQAAMAQSRDVPSKETLRKLIAGEWVVSVGPNPSSARITGNAIWNSSCWSRYKILAVRPGKMNKISAYVVEIELTSAGGPGDCGHSSKPGFSLALISADDVRSGNVTSMSWMNCSSKRDVDSALQYQDPRDSNVCSRFGMGR